ncbi:GNAT family N-acetyltransferase [Massilia aerilata]|uniref:GNAT family N-acetyltransferase n=1 Tax=Massilia aerilata TaxID=453817 RepID=A0ABW0RR97_9BURK
MPGIAIVHRSELARVRAFYEEAGYGGGVLDIDRVFAATTDGRIVGVVRLCEEEGVIVLRGMHVAAACQRQGIGRALLARCVPWLERGEAFCLPYARLAGFYGEAGFTPAPPETLPRFLAERLDGYRSKGQGVLAMRRAGAAHMPNKSFASRIA